MKLGRPFLEKDTCARPTAAKAPVVRNRLTAAKRRAQAESVLLAASDVPRGLLSLMYPAGRSPALTSTRASCASSVCAGAVVPDEAVAEGAGCVGTACAAAPACAPAQPVPSTATSASAALTDMSRPF